MIMIVYMVGRHLFSWVVVFIIEVEPKTYRWYTKTFFLTYWTLIWKVEDIYVELVYLK